MSNPEPRADGPQAAERALSGIARAACLSFGLLYAIGGPFCAMFQADDVEGKVTVPGTWVAAFWADGVVGCGLLVLALYLGSNSRTAKIVSRAVGCSLFVIGGAFSLLRDSPTGPFLVTMLPVATLVAPLLLLAGFGQGADRAASRPAVF